MWVTHHVTGGVGRSVRSGPVEVTVQPCTSVEGSSMPKAVVLTHYGPPDVLVWSDVPMPEPGAGQVRIRIKAAGGSLTDPKIRRGDLKAVFPLPAGAVLGFEAAGVVDALGPSVTGVQEGDEVAS